MPCYHPLRAYKTAAGDVVFDEKRRHGNITSQLDLPCGRCTGCRMQRVSHWATRIMHEAQSWSDNCFITLTYGRGNLPPNSSLEHRDYQLFQKRLAAKHGKTIRFYMCGEYGDETGRPHYHACLFNHNFYDRKERGKSGSGEDMYESEELTKAWGMGNCTVQDLNERTAAYCAGYIMKKTLGEGAETAYNIVTEDGEIIQRKPPYSAQSLKPGIGAHWLERNGKTDAFGHDFIIVNGQKRALPPYYNKVLKRKNGGLLPERTDIKRQESSILSRPESTPARLAIREEVHKARIRNQKRNLE